MRTLPTMTESADLAIAQSFRYGGTLVREANARMSAAWRTATLADIHDAVRVVPTAPCGRFVP